MGDNADWEWMQAELDMQQLIEEALDAAAEGKASDEQLRLLAWQAGLTNWKRKANAAHR